MKTIRTFIAIELPSAAVTAITELQQRLMTTVPPHAVRWTPAGNIHLTLHFLGNINTAYVDKLTDVVHTVAQGYPPFQLTLNGLGCFPNLHRPRIVWVGVSGEIDALTALHQELGHKLKVIDFEPEDRPYAPHLTIGRVKKGIPSRRLRQLSETLQQIQPAVGKLAVLPVSEISLIKSDLKPTGPVYTPLVRGRLRPLSADQ